MKLQDGSQASVCSSRLLIEECAGVELLRRDNCHNVLQKHAVKWQIEDQEGGEASSCKYKGVDRGMRRCGAFEKRQLPNSATQAGSQMAKRRSERHPGEKGQR